MKGQRRGRQGARAQRSLQGWAQGHCQGLEEAPGSWGEHLVGPGMLGAGERGLLSKRESAKGCDPGAGGGAPEPPRGRRAARLWGAEQEPETDGPVSLLHRTCWEPGAHCSPEIPLGAPTGPPPGPQGPGSWWHCIWPYGQTRLGERPLDTCSSPETARGSRCQCAVCGGPASA